MSRFSLHVAMISFIALSGARARSAPPPVPGESDQIGAAIRDLGHASYERRAQATRRLIAAGVRAYEPLRSAADDPSAEIALRARGIITLIDELWFAGVDVTLALSRDRVRWNEPVDLLVTLSNASTHRARVPFDTDPARRAASNVDARQVGDMLDAAEWITVRGPDEREVELRVDDTTGDAAVSGVLQDRIRGETSGGLAPGETVTLRVENINRGWARFALLDRGAYALTLDFTPAWDDEWLAQARAGRVVSNTVVLTVTESAPELVSRRGALSSITVDGEGDVLVARAVNRSDQPLYINTNFGVSPPFAQGRWVFEAGGITRDVALPGKAGAGYADFRDLNVVKVEPGTGIELARVTTEELRARLAQSGVNPATTPGEVHFGYANLLTRQWQQRQPTDGLDAPDVPPLLRAPLPRAMLSGWHTSDRVRWPSD